jgi:hypothetical protein
MTEQTTTPTPTVRFQIASRLGGFRDTLPFSDPFDTGARFHICRKGSAAHRTWFKRWQDEDPVSSRYLESVVTGDDKPELTPDESATVQIARTSTDPAALSLLPIIDRLSETYSELDRNRDAVREAIKAGELSPTDAIQRGQRKRLEEALFLVSDWIGMLDETGAEVPFAPEALRSLLENDTPLEGAGIDELLLRHECWTWTPKAEEGELSDSTPKPIIIPGLTLGSAYILWIHHTASTAANFRDQLTEAAAKNSEPFSETTTISGNGTNNPTQENS